ncbi:MAG: aminotransferase class V-fold PLP-dependent enzyme [Chloroflexota bacterium]
MRRILVFRLSTWTAPLLRQKPLPVIEAMNHLLSCHTNANVHRGIHRPSRKRRPTPTIWARERIARFINADSAEVIYVRNATEAFNLVAYRHWGRANLQPGAMTKLDYGDGASCQHRAPAKFIEERVWCCGMCHFCRMARWIWTHCPTC